MAKFSSDAVEPFVSRLVINFLNAARKPEDIAGVEPQEGPIFDDPMRGYGDQIADCDIGLTVARRLIKKRDALGGYTSIAQLSDVAGFGRDKLDDMVHSFTRGARMGRDIVLTPCPLTVPLGGNAALFFRLAVEHNGQQPDFTAESSDPEKVPVSGPVVLSGAGLKAFLVDGSKISLEELRPRRPAARITVRASGFQPAEIDVWVVPGQGQWRDGPTTTVEAVHAALMPTSRVLLFAWNDHDPYNPNKGESILWDPVTDKVMGFPLRRNLFCCGHCLLPDGRLLAAGGFNGAEADLHTFGRLLTVPGIGWTRHDDMGKKRWYPTCTTLPDGTALIVSGAPSAAEWATLRSVTKTFEIFDPASNKLTRSQPLGIETKLYPFVHVLPRGGTSRNQHGVLFFHSENVTRLLSLREARLSPFGSRFQKKFKMLTRNTRTYPGQGACVLLPIDMRLPQVRLLAVGGGDETREKVGEDVVATNTAEIFDFDPEDPSNSTWRATSSTAIRRFMSDAILLPDGTVLIVGGARRGEADHSSNPVLEAELFDPLSETWRMLAAMKLPRTYHQVALLLPDGRIMVAGHTWEFNPNVRRHGLEIEIFSPPYLFGGPSPVIGKILPGETLGYGQEFSVSYTEDEACPAGITSVALMRLGSTTHSNNMDQRLLRLKFTRESGLNLLRVESPPDSTFAPPGFYLLFLVDARGTPSVGKMVKLALE